MMRVALKVELSSLPSCSWTLQTGSFAIAHGLKLVRVRNQGRSLFCNRYMDNQGNQIEEERAKFIDRIEDQRGSDGVVIIIRRPQTQGVGLSLVATAVPWIVHRSFLT